MEQTNQTQMGAAMAEPVSSARSDETPGLLRSDEAAKLLAISPRTLWSLADEGEIPVVRIGRSVRYDPADLQDYIERQKHRKAG